MADKINAEEKAYWTWKYRIETIQNETCGDKRLGINNEQSI